MPNINGTSGADNIDVTNDNGELNGTAVGTPIDKVTGRNGADDITITDSTISGVVRAHQGKDTVTISGSTITGVTHTGSGADTVTVQDSTLENLRLGGGNDTVTLRTTTVTGVIDGASGSDALNLPAGTLVTDTTHGTFTVSDGVGYSLSSGSFLLPTGQTITYMALESGTGFPCFCRGTAIVTACGVRPVEHLRAGDLVLTQDGSPRRLRWIGSRRINRQDLTQNPNTRPVRIVAGALGNGLPLRDLLVSRQHRMLVQSKIAQRMFGVSEVLIAAIRLTALPGVFLDDRADSVEYFHLLFDDHEIILAEGAPTESLFTGPHAMKSLTAAARAEIMTLFPELMQQDHAPEPARRIPAGSKQKRLIARHLKNEKPLLQHCPGRVPTGASMAMPEQGNPNRV